MTHAESIRMRHATDNSGGAPAYALRHSGRASGRRGEGAERVAAGAVRYTKSAARAMRSAIRDFRIAAPSRGGVEPAMPETDGNERMGLAFCVRTMRRHLLLCTAFVAGVAIGVDARGDEAQAHEAGHGSGHWGMLQQYCTECHNAEDWAGGVAFDIMEPSSLAEDAKVWEATVRKLRGRLMPPPGDPQPSQQEIDSFVRWMEASLDSSRQIPRAGHVPVQRLNRTQYANAVRDLLAVDIKVEELLPPEIEVEGFDNIAAALSVSPAFLDQYIAAARTVARLAVGDPAPKVSVSFYPSPGGAQDTYLDGMPLGSRGGMSFKHHFPADGEYRITIKDLDVGLYPQAAETRHTLVILIGGREVFRGDVGGPEDLELVDREGAAGRAKLMERFAGIPVQVKAGMHEVVVTFVERARALSDEYIQSSGLMFGAFDRLRVPRLLDGIEIEGPVKVTGVSKTPSREKIFICEPRSPDEEFACARRITENLARRAYRRPVDQSDIDRLMPFFEAGRKLSGGFDAGIQQIVTAVLASPDFLYRAIVPPENGDHSPVHPLSDLELASRLSFFLWSRGPDDELLELASAGKLSDPQTLEAQVRRMLADPRAKTLVTGFAMRWLNVDDLTAVDPDPQLFPTFTPALREDFSKEIELFLESILLEDRSVVRLLDADHTFLNERLARHYGIDNVRGTQFRRVQLADRARWGVLGKAAVLLRTSYGDRTSPVLRGAWILEKLMGTPATPPPPGVETNLNPPEGQKPTTLRARLEVHRATRSCNQCHGVIDPLGLALENFDVTGRWRDFDPQAEQPIDASTVLPNGSFVNGPVELRQDLLRRPEQFVLAFTEKLLMYAVGREIEYHDMPQVRAIVRDAAKDDYRFSSIVMGIVRSDAFRMQAVPHGEKPAGEQVAAVVPRGGAVN
jgi:Uncharacterized protein involved in ubiquinone biosynthesis